MYTGRPGRETPCHYLDHWTSVLASPRLDRTLVVRLRLGFLDIAVPDLSLPSLEGAAALDMRDTEAILLPLQVEVFQTRFDVPEGFG